MTVPPFATAAQAIAHFAAARPDDDAIIDEGMRIGWLKLAHAVARFAEALRELGVRPGMLVVVEGWDRSVHWMVLLACEVLGAPTASLTRAQLVPANPLFARCGLVLSESPPPPEAPRWHRITAPWIMATLRRGLGADALAQLAGPGHPGAILRYCATSGTTGRPKVLAMTGTQFLTVSEGKTRDCPLHRFAAPRFLTTYAFTLRFAHARATGCLLRGGTVIFSAGDAILADIARHAPHVVSMVTGTLAELLRALPADFRKPDFLALSTTGAPLPAGMRADVLRRFATEVIDLYSSNETSTVAVMDADGLGTVLPDMAVAIVDELGRPLPPGTPGAVLVRGPTVLDSYVDDPAGTAAHFRHGGFVTSDVGVLDPAGRLRILGRSDDMLNLGGIKVSPYPIEAELRRCAHVRDAIVVAIEAPEGSVLCAAVEPAGRTLPAAEALHAVLTPYGRHRFALVEALPLSAGNKPDRAAVAALFRPGGGAA